MLNKINTYLHVTNKTVLNDFLRIKVGDIVSIIYWKVGSNMWTQRVFGICIKKSNKNIGSTLIIRNGFDDVGIEHLILCGSPRVLSVRVLVGWVNKHWWAKLYYFWERGISWSTV